jgi:glycosyltransferase involved in cell wall biosynthesis
VRILVITNMYPPHSYGGYELSCADVVGEWSKAGHDVTVLTSTVTRPGVSAGADPPWVRRELLLYWHEHRLVSPPRHRRLSIERRNQRALQRALRSSRPDVVSVWNMGAVSLGLLSAVERHGLPMTLVVCDDWLIYGPKLDAWTRMFRRRARLGRLVEWVVGTPTSLPKLDGAATRVCFVSHSVKQYAAGEGAWSFPAAPVIPSGIRIEDFPAAPRPATWSGRLLYVGRIDPRKGIATLLVALAELTDTTLQVVGGGDDEHARDLRQTAARLGLADRVGWLEANRGELAGCYAAADAFVFPSEWAEPFGLTPLEAMACGTPVIATGAGGSAEYLAGGANCVLFPAGDSAALAAAVRRLAGDPKLRSALTVGGRATAERFTVRRYATELERLHQAAAAAGLQR